jgi:hypothetical protein
LPGNLSGQTVTATATDPSGNTSEFSPWMLYQGGLVIVNLAAHKFAQSVTLTNTSGHTLTGPLDLVLDQLTGATLTNATGTTSGGRAYISFGVSSLAPGASVTIVLQFKLTSVSPNYYAYVAPGSSLSSFSVRKRVVKSPTVDPAPKPGAKVHKKTKGRG